MYYDDTKLTELFHKDYYAESIYQKYHIAKNTGKLSDFFATLDINKIRQNNMWMYELFGPLPSQSCGFPGIEKQNIYIVKHASYLPEFTHCHDFFEIIYVYSGNCDNIVNGNKIHMISNDICIMSPNSYHSLRVFNSSIVTNIILKKDAVKNRFIDIFSDYINILKFPCHSKIKQRTAGFNFIIYQHIKRN